MIFSVLFGALCVTHIVLPTSGIVVQVCPNLDILVPALVEGGIDELEKRCALTPGIFGTAPCGKFAPHKLYPSSYL